MSTVEKWETDEQWSVGEVAQRLGLPASTLRTWERRYGIGPTARSAGGHRRYVAADALHLEHMASLVAQGVPAAEAARLVHRSVEVVSETRAGASPDLDEREHSAFADAVISAARSYDSSEVRRLLLQAVESHDITTAWENQLAPTLRRVGTEWTTGGLSVGGEHLVSDCLVTVLRAHVHEHTTGANEHRSVLLASAEDDPHALPLLALQAALADEGVHCHALGASTPASSVAGITLRLEPAAVFLWASLPRSEGDTLARVVTAAAERTVVLLGGPGWSDVTLGDARRCESLSAALGAVRDSLARA